MSETAYCLRVDPFDCISASPQVHSENLFLLSKSELCYSGSSTLLMRFWVQARLALADSIVKKHLWIESLEYQSTADAVLK